MSISREVLAKYVKPGCRFVETGTRWGDTAIRARELGAALVQSCEIDPMMAGIARARVNDVLRDDAANVLISPNASEAWLSWMQHQKFDPTIVYLDAHAETRSPVLEELSVISKWAFPPEAILIDDMRCMEGWGVKKDDILAKLSAMGFTHISYEPGIVPEDILVANR